MISQLELPCKWPVCDFAGAKDARLSHEESCRHRRSVVSVCGGERVSELA